MNIAAGKLLQAGRWAWEPNDEAGDLDIWHYWDGPLVGTFKQQDDNASYLFAVDWRTEDFDSWLYIPLTQQETEEFATIIFDDGKDMWQLIRDLCDGRDCLLAKADEGKLLEEEPQVVQRVPWLETPDEKLSHEDASA